MGYISRTRLFLTRDFRELLDNDEYYNLACFQKNRSRKVEKNSYWGFFGHVWAILGKTRFFWEKRALSVFFIYNPLTVYAISEKSLEPFSRTFSDTRTHGHSQVLAQLKLRIVAYWRTGLNFSHKLFQKTTFILVLKGFVSIVLF